MKYLLGNCVKYKLSFHNIKPFAFSQMLIKCRQHTYVDILAPVRVIEGTSSKQIFSFIDCNLLLYWIKLLRPLWVSCCNLFDLIGFLAVLVSFYNTSPLMRVGSKCKRMNRFGHTTIYISVYFRFSCWYVQVCS